MCIFRFVLLAAPPDSVSDRETGTTDSGPSTAVFPTLFAGLLIGLVDLDLLQEVETTHARTCSAEHTLKATLKANPSLFFPKGVKGVVPDVLDKKPVSCWFLLSMSPKRKYIEKGHTL